MGETSTLTRRKSLPTNSPDEPEKQDIIPAPTEDPDERQKGECNPVKSAREAQQPNLQPPQNDLSLPPPKTWRFWAVFPALCMTTFLAALDTSILSTALPTIALDLHAGNLYMWITNSYILSSTVVLPLFGQMANIFGRRWMMISSVVIFAVGSAMAGGANNVGAIIAGRTVQGIGGGGINTLVDVVICDLVPLRQRGKYVALMASVWAVGTTIGPVLGGVLAQYVSWRWVFLINLPLCAVSLLLLVLFLRVTHPRSPGTIWQQLQRVDVVGNTILTMAVVAILLALTWAGTAYPWSSGRVLVPLFLGLAGLVLFYGHQNSRFCPEPSLPLPLFSSATALCALWISFLQNLLLYWVGYFLPIYFQAIRSLTATESGVHVLPITGAIAPFGVITGILIAVTGKYRVFHFVGYTCLTAGSGLLALLNRHSPARDWAGFQVLFGVGSGMIFSSTLPPIQATLPESDVATATATWAFVRSFGCIWGIAIPTTIFNTRVQALLYRVSSQALREKLANGGAYALASDGLMRTLSDTPGLEAEVLGVYEESLRWVWWMAIPFGVVGLILSIPIKQLVLSEELHTEFGLQEVSRAEQ
ncbi:MFS general substrate transporter [Aspergillus sclerotioniger CBS 115572]|uniref:MFS general substrate transporter n=1 Tax=Aspergillus sclerotioniger CBS 115572 TaxID=1450535 RepID=A0A317WDS6_9EURO|nr:MFS general substrate transporter [Aspergillus sclerotioniger CBS 115572]PWY83891.1 MFS general substrate transporter [Aspergillus sclerotioniger CBS 115572]